MGPILVNKAKCLHCRDVLISEKEYETCSCGKLTIGLGSCVQYRTGKQDEDYKELVVLNQEFFGDMNPEDKIPEDVPRA